MSKSLAHIARISIETPAGRVQTVCAVELAIAIFWLLSWPTTRLMAILSVRFAQWVAWVWPQFHRFWLDVVMDLDCLFRLVVHPADVVGAFAG